jgi:RecB family endonuclease NucS
MKLTDTAAFIIYGNMSVTYDGRARSTIGPCELLLIHKADGSVLIHGGDLTTPKNYMPPGAKLDREHDASIFGTAIASTIIFTRKNEKLTITIHAVLQYMGGYQPDSMSEWSTDKIAITRTEKELVDKLIDNPKQYFGFEPKHIEREYPTDYGPVDIALFHNPIGELAIGANHSHPIDLHAVEVKRRKATINDCTQLLKYHDSLTQAGYIVKKCIAAPDISKNAKVFCEDKKIDYIYVDW